MTAGLHLSFREPLSYYQSYRIIPFCQKGNCRHGDHDKSGAGTVQSGWIVPLADISNDPKCDTAHTWIVCPCRLPPGSLFTPLSETPSVFGVMRGGRDGF